MSDVNEKKSPRSGIGSIHPAYAALILLYCAGIFWLSAQSDPPKPDVSFPGADKLAHALMYAGLAGLVSEGLRRAPVPPGPGPRRWGPVLFAAFYGITDEIHQLFTPKRTFDLFDLLADTAGALAAQAILTVFWRRMEPARGKMHGKARDRE